MRRPIPPVMFVRQPVPTPERRLWRAVLDQARADASASPQCDPEVEPATRAIARRFLRAASPGEARSLALLCEFADVPYDRVVLWARRQFPPEPAGQDSVEEIIAEEILTVELSDSAPN